MTYRKDDEKANKIKSTVKVLSQIIPLVIRVAPFLFGLILMHKLVLAFIPTAQVYVLKEITDTVVSVLQGHARLVQAVSWLIMSMILTFVLIGAQASESYIMLLLKQRFEHLMGKTLAEKSVHIPLIKFEQPQYYDQLQRAKTNISFRGFHVVETMLGIFQSTFTIIGYAILLINFSWMLLVALIIASVPTLLVHMRIGEWRFFLMRFQTPHIRRLNYFFGLLTDRVSMKEIKLYQLASTLLKTWSEYFWKNADEQRKVERRTLKARGTLEGLDGLIIFALSVYVVWVCYVKQMLIGTYVAVAQVLVSTQQQMRSIAYSITQLYEESLFINDYFLFMAIEEEELQEDGEQPEGAVTEGVSVKNLTFSYPTNSKPVLKNISFELKANQTVAIVGENGAGKSTLVNCLIGLHQSYDGDIKYDGMDLKNMNLHHFRSKVAAVFQDYLRFQMSVKDNIGFGDIERMDDLASIETAAALSGASEVVSTLQDEYETLLGPVFEGGTELSVGQWQKLALGRAFFRDADIVLLDEPTASMDPMAESALYEHFAALSQDKLVYLVSHRLGSCRIADYILVMKDGELVEQGTHEELLALEGEYSRMYAAQAKWYK